MVPIYGGILLSHKKEGNNAICSNMDGPSDYHTKWSQTKTNIWYHLYHFDITYQKMIQMNLFTQQKQTHWQRKQTYG